MPSPDLLPKGRSFPSVVAPPLDDVLKGARHRRARHAAVVGVVAAAAVAATTFAFVPRGSSQSMDTVTPARPDQSASPRPAAHVPPPVAEHRRLHDAKTSTSNADAAATHQDATGSAAHTHGMTTAPSEAQGDPTVGTSVQRTVGPPHRTTRYDPTQPCDGSGPTVAQGWCSYYTGATAGAAGKTVTLATAVCRLPGQGGATLTSPTGRQADFAVGKQSYPPVWRWGHGRRFDQSASSIRVAAGTCVEWYVTWQVVDNAGNPLTPGRYYLDAFPRVRPADQPATGYASSPATFTVR